jgi:hypothetical protein
MPSKFGLVFDVRFGRRFSALGVDFGAFWGGFWRPKPVPGETPEQEGEFAKTVVLLSKTMIFQGLARPGTTRNPSKER